MVEYNGWFSINESLNGENENEIISVALEIERFINFINDSNGLIVLKPMNGKYYLHIGGYTNHRNQEIEEVFSLLNFISEIAKGSYGLLYYRDDEDKNKNNEFIIYKLAKGKITKEDDNLLSPCNPKIEN